MKLPNTFLNDIQGNDVQLIPLVIIERDTGNTDIDVVNNFNDSNARQSILLSTHTVHIDDPDMTPTITDYDPLLLNNPVISEKIDIENRKFTISKCTFKISNHEYNGQKFTDILSEDPLIGKKITFGYKSINSRFLFPSFEMRYMTGLFGFAKTWSNLYSSHPSGAFEVLSPVFFFGEIRDIKHDNETITITAEDLGANMLHQQIPKNSLPKDSTVEEFYRGATIPMVYGYVYKAPVVMGANKKIYADSRPIQQFWHNQVHRQSRYSYPFSTSDSGSLFISIDGHLCNISNALKRKLPATADITDWSAFTAGDPQIISDEDDIYDTKILRFSSNPLLSRRMIQVECVYKPSKVVLEKREQHDAGDFSEANPSLGDGSSIWDNTDLLDESEWTMMTDGNFKSEYSAGESDGELSCRSGAYINTLGEEEQIVTNRYKHSLFRFVIDTEPPIEYYARGGTGYNPTGGFLTTDHGGIYDHWIAFGHWVMPEQGYMSEEANHHIYVMAKNASNDLSYQTIRERNYTIDGEYILKDYGWSTPRIPASATEHNSPYGVAFQDTWGREIQFCDIVRFSDYHTGTYSSINTESVNWDQYPHYSSSLQKSPLEFYGLNTINETGDTGYDGANKQYVNPYAKFTNISNVGKYIVELGAYGCRTSNDISPPNTTTLADTVLYTRFTSSGGICYNFDYQGYMKGWLPEVTCMSICDVKTNFQNMYASVKGRTGINHPADVIQDIFVNELGHSINQVDSDSIMSVKSVDGHDGWKFSFSQKDKINSKELIEDIARSTLMFPNIGFDGFLRFPSFKKQYSQADYEAAILIQSSDIIKYSYELTKRQLLKSETKLNFNYDHEHDEYFGDENTISNSDNADTLKAVGHSEHLSVMSDDLASYYGIEDKESIINEVDSKYIRNDYYAIADHFDNNVFERTIRRMIPMFNRFYKIRHLIMKCTLPLRYLKVGLGDYLRFDYLMDDIEPYGINYVKLTSSVMLNTFLYPMFMCISIKKSIESVELELIQLPHLKQGAMTDYDFFSNLNPQTVPEIYGTTSFADIDYVHGCTDSNALNYNADANIDDGSCEYAPPGVMGCTDSSAVNYNPDATQDDGTCQYIPDAGYTFVFTPGYFYQFNFESLFDDNTLEWTSLALGQVSMPYIESNVYSVAPDEDGNHYSLHRVIALSNDLDAPFHSNYLSFGETTFVEGNASNVSSGINSLFNPERWLMKISEDDNFQAISSFEDLLPADYGTVVNSSNLDYPIIRIRIDYERVGSDPYVIYELKNFNQNIGENLHLELKEVDRAYLPNEGTAAAVGGHDLDYFSFKNPRITITNLTGYYIVWQELVPIRDILEVGNIELPATPTGVLGDINTDGITDILDLISVINHILGTALLQEWQLEIADTTGDGVINILDVMVIMNNILEN